EPWRRDGSSLYLLLETSEVPVTITSPQLPSCPAACLYAPSALTSHSLTHTLLCSPSCTSSQART
ncbi:unnamed protein product, partial [Ectocarpus sp. 12 AP-2014]